MGSPVLGWQTPAAMLAGLRTRSEGKALGADGQRAEQGSGLCPGSSEQFGLSRAWHGEPGDGGVMPLFSTCQASPRTLPPVWGPIQAGGTSRGSGEASGMDGGARALPCKEVLAALWGVTVFVFGLLFFAFRFVLACLLAFFKRPCMPHQEHKQWRSLTSTTSVSCPVFARSGQTKPPSMPSPVAALALETKPKREAKSRSLPQRRTYT